MNDLKPNTSRSDSRTDVLLPRNMRHHESDPLETNGKDGRKPGVDAEICSGGEQRSREGERPLHQQHCRHIIQWSEAKGATTRCINWCQ